MYGRRLLVALSVAIMLAGPALGASPQDRTDCAADDADRAIPACSRIIPDQDESLQQRADAYANRARAYLTQGNVSRAIADCNEAIKLAPRSAAAYVRRAVGYFRSNDKDRAILDYSIADKLDAAAVARMAAEPQVEEVAAAARAAPPSPAALGLIIDQLAAAPPPPVAAPPVVPPPAAAARPEPRAPVAQAPPPAPKPWNSVAAAIWKVSGRVRVAVGYSGTRSSQEQARASAQEACRNAGGQNCQVKGAWNYGCVYITTGNTTNRAGWGSGSTTAEALRKCREQGLTCKDPIGGCVE
jgi:tetratricopeptide (TPR) repeat protein